MMFVIVHLSVKAFAEAALCVCVCDATGGYGMMTSSSSGNLCSAIIITTLCNKYRKRTQTHMCGRQNRTTLV